MAELNTKNKKKEFNYKALFIVVGVLGFLVLFYFLFQFFNGNNQTKSEGPKANLGRVVDGSQKSYQGQELIVDADVKNQKQKQIEEQRKTAEKKDTTHIESLPSDAKLVDTSETGTKVEDLLNKEFIPCVTTPYNIDGYNCITKLDKNGFDKDGFDKNGFDKNGCNKEGKDVVGKPCGSLLPKIEQSCLDKIDQKTCEDLAKYDKDGYDAKGCDKQGYNRAGYSCAAPYCDRQGFDKDGYNCSTGFGRDGFDKNGCDREGYNREGYNCKTGLDREGYDKDGFDKNGFNKQGCNREGKDRNGNSCGKKDEKLSLTGSDMLWLDDELKRKTAFTLELATAMQKESTAGSITVHVITDPKAEAQAEADKAAKEAEKVVASTAKAKDETEEVVQVPVGTMVYAFFDAGVNSDYPGMVRAKITGGPLDGALLTGKSTVPFASSAYMPRDKLQVKFDRMVFKRSTYATDAVGLDLGTATDYMDASVDNHYFTRWGGLVGATFLKGFGRAVSTNQVTSNVDQYGNAAVLPQPLKTTGEQTKAALGEVGNELASIAKSYFDRPPTVSKEQGEQMIIFFNTEIKDDRLPMLFSKDELVENNMIQALNPNYLKTN